MLIIPGPTILLVTSYALSRGTGVALAMVAGVALGDFIAMTISLAGLGALMATSAMLFSIMKWIGAAYLAVMGVRLLLTAARTSQDRAADHVSASASTAASAFRDAALVTVMNPKSIGFFVAFVPQFLDPSTALLPQFGIMIVTFVSLGAINAGLYAFLAGRLSSRISGPGGIRVLQVIGGMTLLGLAVMAAIRRG